MKQFRLHPFRRSAALLLACVLTLSAVLIGTEPAVGAASKLSDATTKKYEEQIAAIQKEQKAIQADLSALQKDINKLQEYKDQVDALLETTQRRMEASNILLNSIDAQIRDTKEEIRQKNEEYDRMYRQFLDTMAASYEEGEASYIGLILGADSLGDFLSRVERVSSILEYNRTIMKSLDETRTELIEKQEALDAKMEEQNAELRRLLSEQEEYETLVADSAAALKTLQAEKTAANADYYKKKAQEDELDKKLEEYLAELQRQNQAKMEAGDWRWPIDLTVSQYCSSGYGWRTLYGVKDFHRGWDIACYLGTEIHAAKSGTVVIAEYHYSYGNYVVIDNGDGVSTVYGHASKLNVKAGQKVAKGDVIAYVGSTGNSTGYHLHFEFRLNGKYTDPAGYIPKPPISVPNL